MIENLRAAVNNTVLKIILGFVAVSLILTGTGNYLINSNHDYAIKINDRQISYAQLKQAMQNERNRQHESTGELTLNEDHIRQYVILQLINESLLDQYADKLGLFVNDDQIKQEIFAIPAFYTENKFDNTKFRTLISNMGLSPDQYADLVRKQLLAKQLIQSIGSTSFLLPVEISRLLAITVQTRAARLATFDIKELAAKQTANDDEIQASYNTHKNKYLSPEIFKVSYIPIDVETIEAKTSVNEQEIQLWYDQHHDQFTIPARKRYSIIQCKNENDANKWLKQLQQGADFATIARAYSTDVISAREGGNIGWINDNESLDELKLINLREKGQLSGVIKSSLGFLIFRLDDIMPEQINPLSMVYDKVVAKVKREKATKTYYILQQKVSDAISNDHKTLALAEAVSGIKAQETDWFIRDNVPAVLNYDIVKQVLFEGALLGNNGAPSNNSNLINIDSNRAFVIRITDHHPEYMQTLQDVRTQVEQEVKRQKAVELATLNAKKVLFALQQNNVKNTEVLKNTIFSSVQYFDSFNQKDTLAQTIFTLPQPIQGKSSYGLATNAQGDIVLIALDSITPRLLDDQQRRAFINQINYGMIGITFDTLLSNLRASAKIKMGTSVDKITLY